MYHFENSEMCRIENSLMLQGFKHIGGIDEAGRGALAGPVVAACIILNPESIPGGVVDSKTISEAVREKLFYELKKSAISIGVGIVDPETIDKINIYNATKLAMKIAVENMSLKPDFLLIDAVKLDNINITGLSMVKGERKSVSIAAASIIAKVTRDRILIELDAKFPEYGFKKHKGYGTAYHRDVLEKYGPTAVHRYSYRPVRESAKRFGIWR